MRIFQYVDPTAPISAPHARDEQTRWIAARDEAAADAYAEAHGWERCGGEILRDHRYADPDLLDIGCDVVLP